MVESKRAERRCRTRTVARRRRDRHLAWLSTFPGVDDTRDAPLYRFARHYLRHRCGKRRHGRPKVGRGACYGWDLRAAVRTRIRSRRLARGLTAGRIDRDAY
jgi:hypothetical protein